MGSYKRTKNFAIICKSSFKVELYLKAYRKTKSQDLTESDMEKRLKRGKRLPRTMTVDNLNKIFFTQENFFKLQCARNSQNDRAYGCSKEETDEERLPVKRTAFSKRDLEFLS